MSSENSSDWVTVSEYPSSYRFSQASHSSSSDLWSEDDDAFAENYGFSPGSQYSGGSSSHTRAFPEQRAHVPNFGPRFGGDPSRASMNFPSFFDDGPQGRPFPPPRMDLAPINTSRHPNDIDWVSKLNLWDQSQRTKTESLYEYRQADNGEHIAQVNVAGRGRYFHGMAKKKHEAKQQAAMRACNALSLRVG